MNMMRNEKWRDVDAQARDQAQAVKLLAMDTSTGMMTLALLADGKPVAGYSSEAERNHSIQLMPAIEELLREYGLRPAQLDGIVVGKGPGSYTGVRIGISVAKTMAWALSVPVVAVSGLEALALGAWRASGGTGGHDAAVGPVWYVPLFDARRKQAFCAVYAFDREGRRNVVAGDGIRVVPDWTGSLLELARGGSEGASVASAASAASAAPSAVSRPSRIVFLGETAGFDTYLEAFGAAFAEGVVEVRPAGMDAVYVGELGWERWQRGELDEVHTLVPNYTQLAEAEVKLLQKEKEQGGDANGGAC
ncbi:tRNA (adenosine(37)-N6)-threonylcarbamoyltransferase complex dimerization subunit type 1 TsaB [Paenibacillus koleovorans]|uniref:tRNA (adenosine(37)-N6)-threonylcarbamoyltransferase complex dimerization subunit type 1 TsaB n=1 Tax=Paenibacillus koleovorans TaxID=121608 RepID=UPI001FE50799|nr:tRNA (adenosine(37)-N6)-threonylcarbamoyltransferase complex dimerization subunit type 1 TsaB [Paenibacillus koleovorans]